MAQTYTRQSSFADGDTITAALFNNEFNQLVNAFSYSSTNAGTTGHRHDGTAGEGGNIHTIGDLDFLNKIVVDSTNNRWGFYVQVASSTVEQLRLQDGALIPVTDSDVDLGTSSLYFKDAYIDSVTTTGNVSVGGNLTVTGTTTFNGGTITMGDAATDNVVFGADVDSHIIPDDDDTYDLGSSTQQWRNLYIDGIAEVDTLTINGTAVTSTAAELNILDGVTSTATELNLLDGVTSTTAEINLLDGVTSTTAELNILDGVTATSTEINILDGVTSTTVELNILDGVTSTATELNLLDGVTSTTAELNILDGVTSTAAELNLLDGKAFLDEDNLISNSATGIASQQSIKAYVDAQVTAQDLDFLGDSGGPLNIDLDSESLTIAGGTGLDTVGTSNTITINIDSTVATLTGSQTLTNKTLTSPVINTGVSGTAFLDDDTFATATASTLASSESIKAYVDTTVAANNEVIEDTTPQLGGNLDLNSNDITGTGDINITGTIQSSGNITGTLATAAQTNITSLGTLTALTGGTGDLNWDSGTLFVDSSSNAVGIGNTNPSTALDVTGTITATTLAGTLSTAAQPNITSVGTLTGLTTTGNINFGDGDKANFGAGLDLKIQHDATNSFIDNETGTLFLRQKSDDKDVIIQSDDGSGGLVDYFKVDGSEGSAILYHYGLNKLATTSTGIDVTGVITTDGLTTSADINFGDNDKAIFGAGSDLQIYHDGTDNHIIADTSNLNIQVVGGGSINLGDKFGNTLLQVNDNADVKLFHGTTPAEKLATTSTGIDVTGTVTADTHFTSSDTNTTLSTSGSGGTIRLRPNGLSSTTGQVTVLSSGDFGIGTDSPSRTLHIKDAVAGIRLEDSDGTSYGEIIYNEGSNGLLIRSDENNADSGSNIIFEVDGGEKARIDSSGNVIVGHTAADDTTASASLRYDGRIYSTVSGDQCLSLNRLSSDGEIITFKKDSAAVGSIGTSTTDLFIGSGVAGLRFREAGPQFMPWNTTTNAANDNAIDIGKSDARFKDLYLSGTGYFGTSVGIGTNSPTAPLTVSGADGTLAVFTNASDADFQFKTASAVAMITPSTGTLAFGTSNTERMRIDSSGNVGIGRTSASSRLHVQGPTDTSTISTSSTPAARINNGGAISLWIGSNAYNYGYVQSIQDDGTNNLKPLSLQPLGGNVGIGTSSPSTALEIVDSTANAVLRLTRNDTVITAGNHIGAIEFAGADTNDAGVSAKIIAEAESGAGQTALAMYTGTPSALSERLRIDKDGLVGIGTTNPDSNLHISSAGGTELHLQEETAGQSAQIKFTNPQNSFVAGSDANPQIFFINTDGNQGSGLCIDTSNNVGIGTSSVDTELHLKAANPRFRIEDSDGGYSEISANGGHLTLQADVGNTQSGSRIVYEIDGSEKMRIDSLGNLGIGTTHPDSKLDVTGGDITLNVSGTGLMNYKYNNSVVGSITTNGAATAFNTSSDARLKDVTGSARGLEVINELNPVAYNWKADGKADEGLIAQEVQEIVPNAVTGSEEDYYQMDYSKLVVHLVKGMKEQQTQIDALQSEINNLKGE